MTKQFFITATGTELGKTFVAASVLRAAMTRGLNPIAVKPLMSGFAPDALKESDAGVLLSALNQPVTPETVGEICLHTFTEPLAPNIAARREKMLLDDAALISFCRDHLTKNPAQYDFRLIEGAGGVLSPATDSMLQADLMRALGLPAILVTANYLGSISHTLATLEAMESRNIPTAAIIVSQPNPTLAEPTAFVEEMRRLRPAQTYIAASHGTDALALGCEILDAVTS